MTGCHVILRQVVNVMRCDARGLGEMRLWCGVAVYCGGLGGDVPSWHCHENMRLPNTAPATRSDTLTSQNIRKEWRSNFCGSFFLLLFLSVMCAFCTAASVFPLFHIFQSRVIELDVGKIVGDLDVAGWKTCWPLHSKLEYWLVTSCESIWHLRKRYQKIWMVQELKSQRDLQKLCVFFILPSHKCTCSVPSDLWRSGK